MENTKKEEFASGVQQLERTQEDFEKVLRQPASPPVYPQSVVVAPAPILSTNNVVVTVPQSTPTIVQNVYDPKPDNGTAICCACFVLWCCCFPLGLAAFIVAVMAPDQRTADDTRRQLRLANGLSLAGVIFAIITLAVVMAVEIA